jgi:hypothetical protein
VVKSYIVTEVLERGLPQHFLVVAKGFSLFYHSLFLHFPIIPFITSSLLQIFTALPGEFVPEVESKVENSR